MPKVHYIKVSAVALEQLLTALNGPQYFIHELQATRNVDFDGTNPINVLAETFRKWAAAQDTDATIETHRRSLTLTGANGNVLHLDDVTPLDGEPVAGIVTNGAWYWRRDDEFEYVHYDASSEEAITKYPRREYVITDDKLTPRSRKRGTADDIPF